MEQRYISNTQKQDLHPSTPGHPHESQTSAEPPNDMAETATKYQEWLKKGTKDVDSMFAKTRDGSAAKSRLTPQFNRQIEIIKVLQMKLNRSKTLIGWNEAESTVWMLLHFSGKSK